MTPKYVKIRRKYVDNTSKIRQNTCTLTVADLSSVGTEGAYSGGYKSMGIAAVGTKVTESVWLALADTIQSRKVL